MFSCFTNIKFSTQHRTERQPGELQRAPDQAALLNGVDQHIGRARHQAQRHAQPRLQGGASAVDAAETAPAAAREYVTFVL